MTLIITNADIPNLNTITISSATVTITTIVTKVIPIVYILAFATPKNTIVIIIHILSLF